jgi:hypothetical protein
LAISTVQKAITPGCTVEASAFRDGDSADAKTGVVVLGVCPNSVESHKEFKAKFNLPFPPLADEGYRGPRPAAPGPRRNAPEGRGWGSYARRF